MRVGDQVKANGYWGAVTEVLNGELYGMIEVRLPGGGVAVPRSEVTARFTEVHYADGFGRWHVLITDHSQSEPRSSDYAQMINLARRRIAAEVTVRSPLGTTFDNVLEGTRVGRKDTNEPYTYEYVERT